MIRKENPSIEIRLGGIYALERTANKSERDYWPTMEILTAYVRKNSSTETSETQDKVSFDIQAILTVIGRCTEFRKHWDYMNLSETNLKKVILRNTNLERTLFGGANLQEAKLSHAYLEGSQFRKANLKGAKLGKVFDNIPATNLKKAFFHKANLKGADLKQVNLQEARLQEVELKGASLVNANLEGVNLKGANLEETNLKGSKNLTVDQLSKVKTLYNAKLYPELEEPLMTEIYTLVCNFAKEIGIQDIPVEFKYGTYQAEIPLDKEFYPKYHTYGESTENLSESEIEAIEEYYEGKT